jgi:hypothetical protein
VDEPGLLVADNDTADFTVDTQKVVFLLPPPIQAAQILVTNLDPETARAEVQNALNSGQLLVNYLGHGSVEVWSGDTLLDDASAAALNNGSRLPVFLSFDCLNGFFQDVYTQSLSETLLPTRQRRRRGSGLIFGIDRCPAAGTTGSQAGGCAMKNSAITLGDAPVQARRESRRTCAAPTCRLGSVVALKALKNCGIDRPGGPPPTSLPASGVNW